MHRISIEREPEVSHPQHGEPSVLVHLAGHPDDRWRQVFLDPAFDSGLRFDVEIVENVVWLSVPTVKVAEALDWLSSRIERVNETSEVREHRIVEHALERAVHEWWRTRRLTPV